MLSDNNLAYAHADDTGMFYGMKFYNDLLMEAGPFGNVQSEVLLRKDKDTFTLKQGWAFPRKVYFNGDECMLPPPDTYPFLPNSAPPSTTILRFGSHCCYGFLVGHCLVIVIYTPMEYESFGF